MNSVEITTAMPMLSGRPPAKWPTKVQVNTARSRESMPFLAVSERHQVMIGPVLITGATGSDHQRSRSDAVSFTTFVPFAVDSGARVYRCGCVRCAIATISSCRQRTVPVRVKNRVSRDDQCCSFTAMCGHVRFSLFRIA
jgi:hypothetical protein